MSLGRYRDACRRKLIGYMDAQDLSADAIRLGDYLDKDPGDPHGPSHANYQIVSLRQGWGSDGNAGAVAVMPWYNEKAPDEMEIVSWLLRVWDYYCSHDTKTLPKSMRLNAEAFHNSGFAEHSRNLERIFNEHHQAPGHSQNPERNESPAM